MSSLPFDRPSGSKNPAGGVIPTAWSVIHAFRLLLLLMVVEEPMKVFDGAKAALVCFDSEEWNENVVYKRIKKRVRWNNSKWEDEWRVYYKKVGDASHRHDDSMSTNKNAKHIFISSIFLLFSSEETTTNGNVCNYSLTPMPLGRRW